MKILLNVSNHNSSTWCKEQTIYWDKIINIQFPDIDPNLDTEDVRVLVNEYFSSIKEYAKEFKNDEIYIMLMGEFTFCYLLYEKIKNHTQWKIALPTTKRVVEELNDKKISIFKFVKFRII